MLDNLLRGLFVAFCVWYGYSLFLEVYVFWYSGSGRLTLLGWLFVGAQVLALAFLVVASFVPMDWCIEPGSR